MSNSVKNYTVTDKHGNRHELAGHYTEFKDNGFVVVIYKDRSGCVSQYKDIEKGVFHEPAAVVEEKGE